MFYTDKYRLGAVEAGQPLDPLEDSRRFLVIDRQLLGLFQVFSNGVVSGWDVAAGGGLAVAISPGRGHIDFMAASTDDTRTVSSLVPNSVNYIYAQATPNTRFDRSVFFFGDTVQFTGGQQVLLAKVQTSATSVTSVDATVRQDISFIETIKDLIKSHKHRGGDLNPTKIDLATEVTGRLPGYRVANLDASTVQSGRLSPSRLPMLNHEDLEHSGTLTHPQLDSLVRNIGDGNVRLLGELSAVNMLQLYMAVKHSWSGVDEFATNTLIMIPGITPDDFIDYTNTTANIDPTNHTISGVTCEAGSLTTTTYDTKVAFQSAKLKSDVEIGEDLSGAFVKLTKPSVPVIVESFDNVFANSVDLTDWTVETVPAQDATTFKSDNSVSVDGEYSGKLSVSQQMRLQATRVFDTSQSWSSYSQIEISIQTTSAYHGKLMFQILKKVNDTYEEVDSFMLLDTNEITAGFRGITHDISDVDVSVVDAIRIYTETGDLGWDLSAFVVNLDSIKLNNNLYYSQSGRIRFRLLMPQTTQWTTLSWTGDTNGGTIQARARTANSYEVFDQSSASVFSAFISTPGDPNVTNNKAIEFELALTSPNDKLATPVIRTIAVTYMTSSETGDGFSFDSVSDFQRASKLENATIESPGNVLITSPLTTGDIVYATKRTVQQVGLSGTGATTVIDHVTAGFGGSKMPIAPMQAAVGMSGESSFDTVSAVERLPDRSYLIADTMNDRVLLLDVDGKLIKGFVSNNVKNVTDTYPLCVYYNSSQKKLYIAWSSNVSTSTLDVSKIVISGAGLSMRLSKSSDVLGSVLVSNTNQSTSNVSVVVLGAAHASQIDAYVSNSSENTSLYLQMESDAISGGVDVSNTNYASLLTTRGMKIFVGDIAFLSGIYRPISVSRTSEGDWLVCNAKPLLFSGSIDPATGESKDNILSLVEIDPIASSIVFSDNSVDFSTITLGGAVELNSAYVVLAGITPTSTSNTTPTTAVDVLKSRMGIIKTIEKSSGRVVRQQLTADNGYPADVQLDANDNLVLVEKFINGTEVSNGRIVKLDDDGNVFFQFGMANMIAPNDVRVLSTGNLIVSA
jgi:hypothetical protein